MIVLVQVVLSFWCDWDLHVCGRFAVANDGFRLLGFMTDRTRLGNSLGA